MRSDSHTLGKSDGILRRCDDFLPECRYDGLTVFRYRSCEFPDTRLYAGDKVMEFFRDGVFLTS